MTIARTRISLASFCALWLALAATALVMTSCGGKSEGPPNLLLITVDTLRPDRLGYGGAERPTSPHIDELAATGVRFTNSYSQSGWTLPSVATILTGQYPKDHGATDFHWSLDSSLPTLAEILSDNGYETQGYVSHVMLTPTYGIGDGFQHYDFQVLNEGHPHDIETSKKLTDLVLRGTQHLESPWFVWVHYFDPHFAYLSHPAFSKWGNKDLDRYDGEIAHTDYHIGRLLRQLDGDNTVVVFTADHGEEFGEHGGKYHYTLHDEVMRTPLVFRAPGLAPGERTLAVDQVDILPTVLALLGVAPPDSLPGRDLFAADLPDDKPIFIERDRPPPWRQQGVIVGAHKLFVVEHVDSTEIPPASRGTEVPVTNVREGIYLYDMAKDPLERNNLFVDTDHTALELLGQLQRHYAVRKYTESSVELDPALMEKLRSLGYIQ